jgi:cytochrome c-type biogenesis protein CcsB
MNLNTLENSLRNSSFICLFLTMLFYWIKGSFFYAKKSSNVETLILLLCNLLLVSILVVRWIDSNHFPLSNLYESLIFLSWSLLTFLLILQIKIKESFLGILLTPIILFITTFATFSLPIEMQKSSSLVPALQSNWLMMHVTIMMLSYAALICGSLLAFTFLIINIILKKDFFFNQDFNSNWSSKISPISSNNSPQFSNDTVLNTTSFSTVYEPISENNQNISQKEISNSKNNEFTDTLDNLSYRTIGIGFPLLTIGILSGAVWANETWGSYWSWDPKETWALITWLIYAIYLHSRIIKGWKGQKPALIASLGFLAVWVCYLGVNIFGKGLHSYGWFD